MSIAVHGVTGWLHEYGHPGVARLEVSFADFPGSFVYRVCAEFVAGTEVAARKPQITELTIAPKDRDDAGPIRAVELKSVPIGKLIDRVRGAVKAYVEAEQQRRWSGHGPGVYAVGEAMSVHRPKDGKELSNDHYRQVAWWYLYYLVAGESPRKAVAAKFGRHAVTVSRWLAEARRRGYLPPYEPVKRGDRMGKWEAWAQADKLMERQVAVRVILDQLNQASAVDPDRLLVDPDAGPDVLGSLTGDLLEGRSDRGQKLRTHVAVEVLEDLVIAGADDIGRKAASLLQALRQDSERDDGRH